MDQFTRNAVIRSSLRRHAEMIPATAATRGTIPTRRQTPAARATSCALDHSGFDRTVFHIRQLSVSLPPDIAAQVESIAGSIDASASRAVLMLVREGLKSRKRRHARLTSIVEQLQASTDGAEQKQLADELGAMLLPEMHAENPVAEPTPRGRSPKAG